MANTYFKGKLRWKAVQRRLEPVRKLYPSRTKNMSAILRKIIIKMQGRIEQVGMEKFVARSVKNVGKTVKYQRGPWSMSTLPQVLSVMFSVSVKRDYSSILDTVAVSAAITGFNC